MTLAVGTAARVASVNRRTASKQSFCLCRPAIVLQRAEFGVDVVHIAGSIEIAGSVAAQVVAFRAHTAAAVSPRIIRIGLAASRSEKLSGRVTQVCRWTGVY